jgi:hypothetical protein
MDCLLKDQQAVFSLYDGQVFSCCLCSLSTVFTTELYAMYQPLHFLHCPLWQYHLICTGSLQSLWSYLSDHLIQECHLYKAEKSVVFCCIPGNTGLLGSEATDLAAEAATLHSLIMSDKLSVVILHCAVLFLWQDPF